MFTLLFQSSQFEQKLVGSIDAWLLMKCILVTLKTYVPLVTYNTEVYDDIRNMDIASRDATEEIHLLLSTGSEGFNFVHFL